MCEVPHPEALPLQEVRGRRGAEQDGRLLAVRMASLVRSLILSIKMGNKKFRLFAKTLSLDLFAMAG